MAMGGVFIACCDTFAFYNLQIDTSCEIVACQIQLSNQTPLIICSIYCPPSSNEIYLDELCQQLESIRHNHTNSALWIAGDINPPDIDWSNYKLSHQ